MLVKNLNHTIGGITGVSKTENNWHLGNAYLSCRKPAGSEQQHRADKVWMGFSCCRGPVQRLVLGRSAIKGQALLLWVPDCTLESWAEEAGSKENIKALQRTVSIPQTHTFLIWPQKRRRQENSPAMLSLVQPRLPLLTRDHSKLQQQCPQQPERLAQCCAWHSHLSMYPMSFVWMSRAFFLGWYPM